jgi:UDP-3-O-[3-hydroxymyristoyl] glucosamine N-acyltransferase
MRLDELIEDVSILGPSFPYIAGVAQLDKAEESDLAFCSYRGEEAYTAISESGAGVVLCRKDVPRLEELVAVKCLVPVDDPRGEFSRCVHRLYGPIAVQPCSVHPSATIHPGVQLGAGVNIQAGVVVGCEGQGWQRGEDGSLRYFPQIGTVVIEEDVEIGANSVITRGTLDETRIGTGTKVGHLCNIGHNCLIGKHVFISAGVTIAGSVEVGDYAWLAPGCSVRSKVKIGVHATVGTGAVVVKDIPDGVTVYGNPARIRR